jgi:hypothetical protein
MDHFHYITEELQVNLTTEKKTVELKKLTC